MRRVHEQEAQRNSEDERARKRKDAVAKLWAEVKTVENRECQLIAILESPPLQWWPQREPFQTPHYPVDLTDDEYPFVGPELPLKERQTDAERRREQAAHIGSLQASIDLKARLLAAREHYAMPSRLDSGSKVVLRMLAEHSTFTALHMPTRGPVQRPPLRRWGAPKPNWAAPTPAGTKGLSSQTVQKLRQARKYIARGMSQAAAYRRVAEDWNNLQSAMKAIDRTHVEELLTWTAIKQLDHKHRDHQMPSPASSTSFESNLNQGAWQTTLEVYFQALWGPPLAYVGHLPNIDVQGVRVTVTSPSG